MFPPLTTSRPSHERSFRALVRGAVDTALEFATLGEATVPERSERPRPIAPTYEHPHRRPLGRQQRRRRPGMATPRAQVCVTPGIPRPARRD